MMRVSFLFILFFVSVHSFCQYDAIKPQGIYSSNFTIDEKPRTITYYMPLSYSKQEVYPLLIVLHPEKSNAAAIIKRYGEEIQAKADSAGCIVLYAEAYKGHWNSDPKDSVNDVGFINIMLEFFARQFGCDISEMRMLGIGTGGNLCYRFICESIHQPVAVETINATLTGKNFSDCRNRQAVPNMNTTTEVVSKANVKQVLSRLFTYKK